VTVPHLDALYGFAVNRLRDAEAAKDVVQETCLKAFRAFDRFEHGTEYKNWLFRILINSITDWWRKVARAAPLVSLEQAEGEGEQRDVPVAAPLDPERQFFANSFAGDIEAALATLPPEAYTVIYLSFVESLTYKEIANVVGCPIGTVMSRLYRARQALRHHLAATLSEHGATVRPRREAATVQPIDLIRARMRDRLRAKGA
jgi:RNA polymerase sigma-70 factor (ECF subfamily)